MQLTSENVAPKTVVERGAETVQFANSVNHTVNGKLSLAGRNVGVVLFSHYLSDPRPRRAAEVLARHGANVEVICLRANGDEPTNETVNGVKIHRVPLKRQRGGKASYIYQYAAFTLAAFTLLTARSFRGRYHLVHVHNMPDVLVFSALVPKMLGAKVILDLHDPMPELMLTIFKLSPESFSVRMLKRFEKWSTGFANVVLTVNLASKRIYSSRSCAPEKIRVVMNSPNEDVFQFRPPSPASQDGNPGGSFTIMYHGSLLPRNGFDLAVKALQTVKKSIPGATLAVCGERTPFFESVMAAAGQSGLQDAINYLGVKKPEQIAEVIDRCDLGIIPNHRNIFTEMNTPTRIFEYLSRGKPVIAPRARGIQDYFDDQDLIYFELGDADDLARKIEYAHFHPNEAMETVERGQNIYLSHRWSQESIGFVDAVAALLGRQ
jgi:glycosyltransferase involved in cell wall biosynthesis